MLIELLQSCHCRLWTVKVLYCCIKSVEKLDFAEVIIFYKMKLVNSTETTVNYFSSTWCMKDRATSCGGVNGSSFAARPLCVVDQEISCSSLVTLRICIVVYISVVNTICTCSVTTIKLLNYNKEQIRQTKSVEY